KCGYINEPLYNIVIRSDSHSRSVTGLYDIYHRTFEHEDILVNTVKLIDMSGNEKDNYLRIIDEKYIRSRFLLMHEHSELFTNHFNELKQKGYLNPKDIVIYYLAKMKLLKFVLKIKNKKI